MKPAKSGKLKFKKFQIYYEIYGSEKSSKIPLLVLHGGPGSAHNYLLGLAKLAGNGRQVIFYDQLGCGESDKPVDTSLWKTQTFVEEVGVVRNALGLKQIHVLGHSWGGMLAIEYMMTKPDGIQSLTLASSMISIPLYQREVDLLKSKLPGNAAAVLKKHEANGTTDSDAYKKAYGVYKKHHLFRGEKFPEQYGMDPEKEGMDAYFTMWGPSEAYCDGNMKNWDRLAELKTIAVPTLITSGQYDELTPYQAGVTRNEIPNSKLNIFTNGSHLTHIEREKDYLETVEAFLSDND